MSHPTFAIERCPPGPGGEGPAGGTPEGGAPRRTAVVRDAASALILAVALSWGLTATFGLPPIVLTLTLTLQLTLGLLLLPGAVGGGSLRGDGAPGGMGWANRVTLGRSVLVSPVAALAVGVASGAVAATPAVLWVAIALSTLALMLDGLDGRVARKTGSASAYGARFDMELDAFLLLALSLLLLGAGRGGAWVLLIGALRYLFVAAGAVLPWLSAPLPPRYRRKVVCVVQGVGLLVALGPVIPDVLAVGAAAAALALLFWSFAVDTLWLFRHRPAHRESAPLQSPDSAA
jgi:phosphatidylglycerophosphate synthase